MGFNAFKSSSKPSAPKQEEAKASSSQASQGQATSTPSTQTKAPQASTGAPKSSGGVSFLKKGAAAKQAVQEDEAKAEMAKESQGKLFRYRLQDEEDGTLTFLDGELDADGMLDGPIVHEHAIKLNGTWTNFVCTAETDGHCPICAGGDSKPYMAMLFTVIDHKPYTSTSGKNAGKTYVNRKKLFVAKKETMKLLTKKASKHGGLTGCTFEATRSGDKSAAVGSAFDFVSKASLGQVRDKYDLKDEDVKPADYGTELVYRTPEELVELGAGKAPTGPGYQKSTADKKSLASQL